LINDITKSIFLSNVSKYVPVEVILKIIVKSDLQNFSVFFFQICAVKELVHGGRVREVEALLADALVAAATKPQSGYRLTLEVI
jgi:hypothetical protein